jgi:DNA polymerase-3 subunit epsilon
VIYNAEFDLKVMQQSHWRHRLTWDPPYRDQECLMKLYARFVGQRHPAYGSYRWQSLEDAARQCGLDHPNAHRAAADARLTRALLHYLALMA